MANGVPETLRTALRLAPRRFRLPDLPRDLQHAVEDGPEASLAFCIEAARQSTATGTTPDQAIGSAFVDALAWVIRRAAAEPGGDPMFRAQVLHWREPSVREWASLGAQGPGDARELRVAVDAFAHPGKLRDMPEGPLRDRLLGLRDSARAGDWAGLAAGTEAALHGEGPQAPGMQASLQALMAHPALQRLLRASTLSRLDAVRRYQALRTLRSPAGGSAAALERGQSAAREGARAEQVAAQALEHVADAMNGSTGAPGAWRVLRSILTPATLARGADRSKVEWDAAIVRTRSEQDVYDIVLLAEAKTSPAAATTDLPRLLRGLAQLAQAPEDTSHEFACSDGKVRLSGASLRTLQPIGQSIPPQVIYLCPAPPELRPALLGAAARALLLAEPASLRFACTGGHDGSSAGKDLAPVWHALLNEARLRPVLNQYELARRAREAMLHPDDLSAAMEQALHSQAQACGGVPPARKS